ncbi:MAG: flagellar assembly protein FliH [Sporolactobacillus sp.]
MLKIPTFSPLHTKLQLTAVIDPALDALNDAMSAEDIQRALNDKIEAAKSAAAAILAEAEQRRAALHEQMNQAAAAAEREREAAFVQAQHEGYAAGYKKGQMGGQATYAARLDEVNHWIEQAQARYQQTITEAQPDILKLALAVAEKIIGDALSAENGRFVALVEKAVHEVKDQGTIKVTVSPKRYPQVSLAEDALRAVAQGQKIYLYVDRELGDDDCTVETSYGKIDAGAESQFKLIRDKLTELLAGDSP